MSQKYLLLSPRDESRSSNCFTSPVGLVDKTDSRPFCNWPKRTHAGFDYKVNEDTMQGRGLKAQRLEEQRGAGLRTLAP